MLSDEGFAQRNLIDIFDGGPVVHADTSEIRSVRESQKVEIEKIVDECTGLKMLISNCNAEFRACLGAIDVTDSKATIDRLVALQLHLKEGDRLRFVSHRAN